MPRRIDLVGTRGGGIRARRGSAATVVRRKERWKRALRAASGLGPTCNTARRVKSNHGTSGIELRPKTKLESHQPTPNTRRFHESGQWNCTLVPPLQYEPRSTFVWNMDTDLEKHEEAVKEAKKCEVLGFVHAGLFFLFEFFGPLHAGVLSF